MTASLTPQALQGVRVLDLTDKSCVYATKILCDLGAEVIRIEPPSGDPMRQMPPMDEATGTSMFHTFMNANKLSVALDLDKPQGRELFAKLVKSSDIVVESLKPGQLDKASIGYKAFEKANPKLIWTTVTPFGSDGPYADWLADDLISQAMGGLMTLSGLPDREPLRLYGEQTCYIAGLHAASGALIAYWHAQATGQGQHVDVSIQECVAHTLENAIQYYTAEGTVRSRQKGRAEPGAGVFQCADGEIFLMAGISMISSSWHNLVKLMRAEKSPGADEMADEKWVQPEFRKTPEAQKRATEIITAFTKSRTKNALYDLFQQNRILSAPMNKVGDVFDNAQLKFLNWFQEQTWGDRSVIWPGPPIRFSETPRRTPTRFAAAGQDTKTVLGKLDAKQESAA